MSKHSINVVRVYLKKHPNADSLSIVNVRGWQVVVKTEEWQDGQLGVYIPPDYVVPERTEFEFLRRYCSIVDGKCQDETKVMKGYRIKVKKLRGELSQGLLIPAPPGCKEGDDVMELLGIGHYEPPLPVTFYGESERPPSIPIPCYDVEPWEQYPDLLVEGEQVIITEKVHGTNARFVWWDDRLWCGSHHSWKREQSSSVWWRVARETEGLVDWLKNHPGVAVYGEIYGDVQNLKYGLRKGELRLALFDVFDKNRWLNPMEARALLPDFRWVPTIYVGEWSKKLVTLANGESLLAKEAGGNHIREGVVIRPLNSRRTPEIGELVLKIVSSDYLSK